MTATLRAFARRLLRRRRSASLPSDPAQVRELRAFERGFDVVVPGDATAASDEADARRALARMNRHYGDVVAAAVVVDAWRAGVG